MRVLTLLRLVCTVAQKEKEQDFWLPSPQGEGLGMRAIQS
jgi:hypothetical protein